jgi:hypothetical protein
MKIFTKIYTFEAFNALADPYQQHFVGPNMPSAYDKPSIRASPFCPFLELRLEAG